MTSHVAERTPTRIRLTLRLDNGGVWRLYDAGRHAVPGRAIRVVGNEVELTEADLS